MRILYVQQHFAGGQGEAGIRGYNLVRTLSARGHEDTVICGRNWRDSALATGKKQWANEQETDGFRVVQLGVFYSNHQGLSVYRSRSDCRFVRLFVSLC